MNNRNIVIPNNVAVALLEDIADPCAVFVKGTGALVWSNAAWISFDAAVRKLSGHQAGDVTAIQGQELAQIVSETGNVASRQTISWASAFDTPIVAHPLSIAEEPHVAILVLGPRPAIELPAAHGGTTQDDLLTGLPGRAAIEARISELNSLTGQTCKYAILFLDLDGFKAINDQWGHLAGDQVLSMVAKRLAGAIRGDDLIVRYGGDEFIILVNGIQRHQELDPVIERLRHAAEEPLHLDSRTLQISVSIGAAFSTEGPSSVAALIAAADRRMYADKGKSTS